VPAAVRFETIQ